MTDQFPTPEASDNPTPPHHLPKGRGGGGEGDLPQSPSNPHPSISKWGSYQGREIGSKRLGHYCQSPILAVFRARESAALHCRAIAIETAAIGAIRVSSTVDISATPEAKNGEKTVISSTCSLFVPYLIDSSTRVSSQDSTRYD